MDTWLDAVRNLRNYCAHHSMLVGTTSSVVIPDNRDSSDVLPDNTNLYSRKTTSHTVIWSVMVL